MSDRFDRLVENWFQPESNALEPTPPAIRGNPAALRLPAFGLGDER